MAGDKKITINVQAEAKGFDQPIKGVRQLSDEVTKLNKVISASGQSGAGKSPGLLGRLFGGAKQGDTFGKQISADAKELRNFQNVMQQTGRVIDKSLTQEFLKSRQALATLIKEQSGLLTRREELQGKASALNELKGDPKRSALYQAQMKALESENAELEQKIASGKDLLSSAHTKTVESKQKRDENRAASGIGGDDDGGMGEKPPSWGERMLPKFGKALGYVKAGVDSAKSVADAYTGSITAPGHYAAGAAQTTAKLYSEIVNGDFSSMAALMRDDKFQVANINSKDSNLSRAYSGADAAENGAFLGAVGNVAGGVGSTVAGSATMVASGGMLGSPAAGMAQLGNGLNFLTNAKGGTNAVEAQTINKMIEDAKASDPIFNMVAQNTFAKAKGYSRHSRMVGGFDELGTAVYAGADEGMHDSEVMDLQMNLRNRIGETRGNQLFESAAKSERMYGIDRNRAAGALTALTEGANGNATQAKQQWEELMSRAFSKGIKDSRLKDEIANAVSESGYGAGGKFDASAIGEMMKNMLNGNSTGLDAKIARDAISFSEKFFGSDTGQGGINTIKMNAGRKMAVSLVNSGLLKGREHLSSDANFHTAIQNMTPAEMEAGGNEQIWNLAGYSDPNQVPQQFKDAIRNEGRNFRGEVSGVVSKHAVNSSVLNKLKGVVENKVGRSMSLKEAMKELQGNPAIFKSLSPLEQQQVTSYQASQATAYSEIAGGSYSAAKESMGIMFGSTSGNATGPNGAVGQQQTPASMPDNVAKGQAMAAADLFARMSDPKNIVALEGAAKASVELIGQLSQLGNAQYVGNPRKVLEEAAGALRSLTNAAGDLVNTVNQRKAASFKPQ